MPWSCKHFCRQLAIQSHLLFLWDWSFDSAINLKQGKKPTFISFQKSNKPDFYKRSEWSTAPLCFNRRMQLAELGLPPRVLSQLRCQVCWEGLSAGSLRSPPCLTPPACAPARELLRAVASLWYRQQAGKNPAGIIICPLVINTVHIWQQH